MRRAKPDFSNPANATSEWLTTPEVAALLRVHPKHVYRLLHSGMPARRVGGQWRFSREAIKQWADQRGEALCADADAALASPPVSTSSIVAMELNEVSEAVVAVVGELSAVRLAMVPTSSKQALELLGTGEVVAAVVRRDDAMNAACATVRISLGARKMGFLTAAGSRAAARPKAIAFAAVARANATVAAWLHAASERGAVVQQAESELEACSRVLRREADAAIGSQAWARRLGLAFHPLDAELWELAVRVDAMEDPNVSRMCVAAQGDAMRERLAAVLDDAAERAGQMRLERGVQAGPAQLIAPDDAAPPDDAPERSRRTVRWTVLTRERAEQMLDLVQVLRDRGLRVGGFVQVPSGPASSKPLGYDLYRLSQPERIPLAERIVHDQRRPTGERYCELTFHTSTLARACEWLREDVAVSDLLIVDGVGRLEERGQGLFPALAWARMQARPKMIVLSSRPDHVPHITQRLALSDRLVTELSFGSETAAPSHVVDHILHACGRIRRSRGQGQSLE